MLSETVLGGNRIDAVSTVQTGEGAANCQKSRHNSVLTGISLLRITIRLNRLKVEYTFSGGYVNNPNKDPRAIAVKTFALKFAQQIYYFLRLTIKTDQTPVEICHKLLAQFGLESDKENRPGAIVATGRPGKRGEQSDRTYLINLEFDPLRMRLLEAARRKLYELVSTTRNKDSDTFIRVVDTSPKPPPDSGDEWTSPENLDDIRRMWRDADSAEVREAIRQVIPADVLELAIAA